LYRYTTVSNHREMPHGLFLVPQLALSRVVYLLNYNCVVLEECSPVGFALFTTSYHVILQAKQYSIGDTRYYPRNQSGTQE
jgi:hypothetical protein